MKALRALGMDGAVAYAFLAKLTSIVGSIGTVLLIVRFLSPVEQGYYYTLLSLVSLQVVFELGFSFVIQQLAAHECVHLEFDSDGGVSGDPQAHARLASALQLSVRWYSMAVRGYGLDSGAAGRCLLFSLCPRWPCKCRLAGSVADRCYRFLRWSVVHAFLRFSRGLRPRACGGRDALSPGCRNRVSRLGVSAASSRPLLACDGPCRLDRRRGSLRGQASAIARRAAASPASCGGHPMEARGMAIPMAHRRELDVFLLHGPGVYPYPVRAARPG